MNRKIKLLLLPIILVLCASLQAQERPEWIDGYFEDLPNSYLEVVSGEGPDWEQARNAAAKRIIQRRSGSTGQSATVSFQADGSIEVEGQKDLIAKNRIIDEYQEIVNGHTCRIYLLVQTAKTINADFEPVRVSDKYPFSARVFVPGMAQIYKGSKGKGVGFIVGEVAFIGGIVASECLRANYISKMNATYNTSLRSAYMQNANICATSRNIAIAGAAALYIWNIIDGVVAKGKTQVMIGQAQLKFSPFATDQIGGLALNLKF